MFSFSVSVILWGSQGVKCLIILKKHSFPQKNGVLNFAHIYMFGSIFMVRDLMGWVRGSTQRENSSWKRIGFWSDKIVFELLQCVPKNILKSLLEHFRLTVRALFSDHCLLRIGMFLDLWLVPFYNHVLMLFNMFSASVLSVSVFGWSGLNTFRCGILW